MNIPKLSDIPSELSALIDPFQPCKEMTGGRSATTVRVHLRAGGPAYLKSVPAELSSEIEDEAKALRWLKGRIRVPDLLGEVVHTEGRAYLLTSELPGRDLSNWAITELEEVVSHYADALRELHSLSYEKCPLDQRLAIKIERARERVRRNQVDLDDLDPVRRGWSSDALVRELDRTRPTSEDLVFTHGDACLPNLIWDGLSTVGHIDLGRAGIADRHQDLSLALRSLAKNLGTTDLFRN